jgi:hypothetical protein
MKKRSVFLFILLLYAIAGVSQVRHVRGIKSLEAGTGVSKFGQLYYLGYVNYFSNKVYGKYNVFYESGKQVGLKYSSIGADISACYSLPPVKEFFYFNLRGGLTASSDKLNPAVLVYDDKGNASLKNYSTLKFGVFGGFEGEAYLSHKLVFIFGWNQRLMLKESFGKNRWFGYTGLRYNL